MRQPDTSAEVEEELRVALDARKELEDEVIESFLSRVQDTIDASVEARVSEVPTRRRLASPSSGRIAVVLGFITAFLFMGVPLADMAGSLVALVAVVTSSVLAAATLILPQRKARNELGPRPG